MVVVGNREHQNEAWQVGERVPSAVGPGGIANRTTIAANVAPVRGVLSVNQRTVSTHGRSVAYGNGVGAVPGIWAAAREECGKSTW